MDSRVDLVPRPSWDDPLTITISSNDSSIDFSGQSTIENMVLYLPSYWENQVSPVVDDFGFEECYGSVLQVMLVIPVVLSSFSISTNMYRSSIVWTINPSHDRLDWILDEWFERGSNDSPEKRADRQVWITTLQIRVHIQDHIPLVKSDCSFSSLLSSNRGSIRPITHPHNQNPVIGRFFTWSFL